MSDMAKYPGLVKRGNVFYFRRRVPDHLVEAHGSREIMVSLKTTDRKEAEDAWLLEHAKTKDAFERLGEQLQAVPVVPQTISAPPPEPARGSRFIRSRTELMRRARRAGAAQHLPPLDAQTIDTLVSLWKSGAVDGCLAQMPPAPPDEAIREREHEIGELSTSDLDARLRIERTADTILNHHELSGIPGEPMYERFCERLRLAMLEVMRFDLARLRGEPVAPPLTVATPLQPASVQTSHTHVSGMTVKEAAKQFWAKKVADRSDLKDRSKDKAQTGLDLLVEFFGPQTFLSSIDEEQCEAFLKFLRYLPPNFSKIREGRSLRELADVAAALDEPGLKRATREGYLAQLRQMLAWAKGKKLIAENPAENVSLGRRGQGDEVRRHSFPPALLRRIFDLPLYRGCQDDGRGFNTEGTEHPRRGRFWVPLLGLFTGARAGELCQLRTLDVMHSEKGTPFIRIHADGEGNSLKTDSSWRSFPIHPELVRIGFLNFVEELREKGQEHLFPELLHPDRIPSYRLSKLFRSMLNALDIKDPGYCFHSFRHTFRDALRLSRTDIEVVEKLGGWSSKRTSSHYGEGYTMDLLHEDICEVQFPDLDLSFLYGEAKRP